jgi:hypothetical protein
MKRSFALEKRKGNHAPSLPQPAPGGKPKLLTNTIG